LKIDRAVTLKRMSSKSA